MPEISGLCLAREIIGFKKDTSIIFITANSEYAVEAFEINAIDYIMKPISIDRLRVCIDRVLQRRGMAEDNKSEILMKIQSSDNDSFLKLNKIVMWQEDGVVLLKPSDILYLFADRGNTVIVTANTKYNSKEALDTWEKKLKEQSFFRCHRSYIVNMKHINRINAWIGSTYNIHLDGISDTVPLSRRNAKSLKEMLQ